MIQQNVSDDPIIGIDLGTTNSLVSYCDAGGPSIIRIDHGAGQMGSLPSVVRLDKQTGKAKVIGAGARDHAVEFPSETIYSVKRLMGRSLGDVEKDAGGLGYEVVAGNQNTARVKVGDFVLSPQEISAMILRELKEIAQAGLGRAVKKAVVTVPAYFDDAQRQATRDAGKIAGLQIVRMINEPTAAALAYHIGESYEDARVAIFDLGGGTFDISILRMQQTDAGRVDQVLAAAGDTHLGGDDVDQMIIDFLQDKIRDKWGQGLVFSPSTKQAFKRLAEQAKKKLSQAEHAQIEIQLPMADGQVAIFKETLSKAWLEKQMSSWIGKAMKCCQKAVADAGLTVAEIDRVILVGGSTRIPLVREAVAQFFGQEGYNALDPDEVVALGAAVQGAILAGIHTDMLLLDVIPLSLGIETVGGAVSKIITANTTIPCVARESYSTYAEGQVNVKIHVLQGEREMVEHCRSLGQFDLKGIPPMPAGFPKLEVTFLVDANGILSVSAVEKRSQVAASIQIVPNHGLTKEEVAKMEADSYANAKQDMLLHRIVDLKTNAKFDLRKIERQLHKFKDALDEAYVSQLEAQMAKVEALIQDDQPDADAFYQTLTDMNHFSVKLHETAITEALKESK